MYCHLSANDTAGIKGRCLSLYHICKIVECAEPGSSNFSPTLAEWGFTSDSMCFFRLMWKTLVPDVLTRSFSLIHT